MAWNQMSSTPPPRKPTGSGKGLIRGIFAALIVIVGAVIVMSIIRGLSSDGDGDEPISAPKKIATFQPATNIAKTVANAPKKLTKEEELFAKTNGYVKAAGKMLTDDGRVLTFPAPKEGEYRIVHSHGKMYRCDSKGNFEDITPKPIFDNSFEECLVGMAMDGGYFIPGMLMGYDEKSVRAMLTKMVVVNPDDPPEVVEKKEAVAYLKSDILEYMEQGGSFDAYVSELHKQTQHERAMKTIAIKEIVTMLKKDNVVDATAYCDKANELFEKNGFKPLRLPSHINEILDSARSNNSEQE